MPFAELINRLSQEINQVEQQATKGLDLANELLSRFPGNAILIQYFAFFNTALLFVETSRRQLQITVETISPANVSNETIQDAGEDLGTLLGRLLEAKLRVERIINRIEQWS